MATGKHAQHADNAGLLGTNIACVRCHADTIASAASDNVLKAGSGKGRAVHVDGTKNVAWDALNAGASAYGSGQAGRCSNLYCHSEWRKSAVNTFLTPNWTDPAWSNVCNGCHGSKTGAGYAVASQSGEPNYASAGAGTDNANSHQRHVTSAADCAKCHNRLYLTFHPHI